MMPETSATGTSASWMERFARLAVAAWATLLVLAIFPVADPVSPIKHCLTGVFSALLALGLLAGGLRRKADRPRLAGLGILIFFLGAHAFAAVCAPHAGAGLYALYPWFAFAVLAFAAARLFALPEHAQALARSVVAAITLSSLYGFVQRLGLDPFPWQTGTSLEFTALPSTYGNPNLAGHALVLGIVLAFGLAARPGGKLWLLPAALMGGHLWLTHMRSGPLALLAAAVFLVVHAGCMRVFRRPLLAALLTCALLVGAAVGGAYWLAREKLPPTGPLPVDSSILLRLNSYMDAAKMALDAPVTGHGPGRYAIESIRYWSPFEQQWYATEGQRNEHVHNDLLEAAAEAGAPGALAYIALMAWAVLGSLVLAARAPECRRWGYTLAACFVAFAADGLFGFNLHAPVSAGLFFLLFGVLAGLLRESGDESPRRAWRMPLAACAVASCCLVASILEFRGAWNLQLAQILRGLDLQQEARDALAQGARELPWDHRFPAELGDLAMGEQRFAEAAAWYEIALREMPTHPRLRMRLAQARISIASRPDSTGAERDAALADAEACAMEAEALCPPLPEVAEARARILLLNAVHAATGAGAGSYRRQALGQLRQALELGFSPSAAVYLLAAHTALDLNDTETPRWALGGAARTAPENPETWALFARQAEATGDAAPYLDALQDSLAAALATQPADVDTAAALATRVAEVFPKVPGNPAAAPAAVVATLLLAPSHLDLWGAYARMYPPGQRWAALQAAAARLPATVEEPLIARLLAEAGGSPEEQVRCSLELINITLSFGENPSGDQVDAAVGWLADLLLTRLGPQLEGQAKGRVLLNLGRLYAAAARQEEADELLAQAIPLLGGPEQGVAQCERSKLLASQGNAAEALVLARQAAANAASSPEARWNLARRLADAKRMEEARASYRLLLVLPGIDESDKAAIEAEIAALDEKEFSK